MNVLRIVVAVAVLAGVGCGVGVEEGIDPALDPTLDLATAEQEVVLGDMGIIGGYPTTCRVRIINGECTDASQRKTVSTTCPGGTKYLVYYRRGAVRRSPSGVPYFTNAGNWILRIEDIRGCK